MTKKTHGIDLSQGGYTEAQFSGATALAASAVCCGGAYHPQGP